MRDQCGERAVREIPQVQDSGNAKFVSGVGAKERRVVGKDLGRAGADHAEAEDGNIDHVKTFPRRGAIQIEIIIARFFPECKQIS